MSSSETDVAIVGSGPYALSLASHLRARGVSHRIFGPPMKFWRDMPRTINLKSLGFGTSIPVPEPGHTFPEYCRARSLEDFEPCPMADFAAYGLWIQEKFVQEIDTTSVTRVSANGGRFELLLADGRRVEAHKVVAATGLSYLQHVPRELAHLPEELVSHTFVHREYDRFRGQDVAVVGGGASAIEAAALVLEAGGRPRLLIRESEAVFHGRMSRDRSLWERVRYPNSVLGPGLKSWFLEHVPMSARLMPDEARVRFVARHLGPAAPWWIKDRVVGKLPIHTSTRLVRADRARSRVSIELRDRDAAEDRAIEVDHVIAGTGYAADVSRLQYLAEELRAKVGRLAGAPRLDRWFQSSVPGLFFVGPIASPSFGPLLRFVAGANFAVPRVVRRLCAA